MNEENAFLKGHSEESLNKRLGPWRRFKGGDKMRGRGRTMPKVFKGSDPLKVEVRRIIAENRARNAEGGRKFRLPTNPKKIRRALSRERRAAARAKA